MDAVTLGDHAPNVQELEGGLTLDFGERLKIHYKCKATGADNLYKFVMPEFYPGVVGAVNLTIESDKACPTANTTGHENSAASIIGGFLTSFALLTSIYFILGTAYNMSVNKEFPDMIPHIDFLRSLISKIRDMINIIVDKVRGGSSSRGGYVHI